MKDKHSFYLKIAELVAQQSYCERNKVGAVIVKNDNIISFGYNGTPRGFDNCCEITTRFIGDFSGKKEVRTKPEVLHAESNAILKCAKNGIASCGAILYLTTSPCFDCCKLIIQSGIIEVYYLTEYRDLSGIKILNDAQINCTKYSYQS